MPNTKKSLTRLVVIDRCLSGEKAMTLKEIMEKVNKELLEQQQPMVSRNSTITKDLNYISQKWKTIIDKKPKGKEYTYQYREPSFSIFKSVLTPSELDKLYQIVNLLKDFTGLPQFEWIEEISAKLHAYAYDNKDVPIVSLSHNPQYADNMKHFTPLFDYIKSKTPIKLTYKKFNCDEITTRTLHPYHLKEFNYRWYVVGWCKEHPDHLSCYGFERIIDFSKSDEAFVENPGFDIEEYFSSMVGLTIYDGTVPQDVLIWVHKDEYPYIKTDPIHHSQKYVCDKDGGMIISLHLYINTELEMQLMSYGKWIRVLAPLELRQKMKDNVKVMSGYYNDSDKEEELKTYYIV